MIEKQVQSTAEGGTGWISFFNPMLHVEKLQPDF